jgi:hypothetical protein
MAQVRYTTRSDAVRAADAVASKNIERDVVIVDEVNSMIDTTVYVIQTRTGSYAVLVSNGTGVWNET